MVLATDVAGGTEGAAGDAEHPAEAALGGGHQAVSLVHLAVGAGVVWALTLAALPLPTMPLTVAGVLLSLAALPGRHRRLLVVGVVVLGAGRSGAVAAPVAVAPPGDAQGVAELVDDPEWVSGALSAQVRFLAAKPWAGQRLTMWLRGEHAAVVADRLLGERLWVAGAVKPRPGDDEWMERQGVAGTVSVTSVRSVGGGARAHGLANGIRRTLVSGAESMDRDQRSLFAGLVFGDDRDQSPLQTDRFRATGLTHLLAVSGQNVVFLLAVLSPVLGRLPRVSRLVAVVGAIALFALVTRFEPSVLRASTMAGLVAVLSFAGLQVVSLRVLGYSVVGLLVVEPELGRSVGFALSVMATLGIVVGSAPVARWLERWVRLPGFVALPVGVTVSAQAATAPLLVVMFDGVPVVSVITNLLAGPAAGVVMGWGVVAGAVAGVVGEPVAGWVHVPTRLLLDWIDVVAVRGASSGLGVVGQRELAVLGGVVCVLFVATWLGPGWQRTCGVAAVAVAVVAVASIGVGARHPGAVVMAEEGMVLARDGSGVTVLVLSDSPSPGRVLEHLRRGSVRRLDVVVAGDGDAALAVVVQRFPEVRILVSAGADVSGAVPLVAGEVYRVGAWELTATGDADLVKLRRR